MLTTPDVPTISTTPPSCSAEGSSTISNYDPMFTYSFMPNDGTSVGAGGVISGMVIGTSYTVTASNGSCTSGSSLSFSNAAMLTTPDVPTITTTPPSCSANGSSMINNYDPMLTYAFTPNDGTSVGAGGVISGMVIGTSYTVTASNGSCTSGSSLSFSNAAMLASPIFTSITSNTPICEGSDAIFYISGTSGATVYYSENGGATQTIVLNSSGNAVLTLNAALSDQTIALSNIVLGSCNTILNISTTVEVTYMSASINYDNPSYCQDYGNVSVNFSGDTGGVFSASPSGLAIDSITGEINTTASLVGIYTVSYTLPDNSPCVNPFVSTVLEIEGIPAITSIDYDAICDGDLANILVNMNNATGFQWQATLTNVTYGGFTSGNETDINQIATLTDPLQQGSITFSILPILTGGNCSGSPETIIVYVNPVPVITDITITPGTASVCSGESVTFTVSGDPSGITYNWTAVLNGVSVVDGITSGTTTTGIVTLTVASTNNTAGDFYVSFTPQIGSCVGLPEDSDSVTVNPIPGSVIPSVYTICSETSLADVFDIQLDFPSSSQYRVEVVCYRCK
ncbi:hypothetical protein [Flavobacterium sp.]|uniref:Ig-like domain-containing protein n=1 Tax=Flavobacterium sp. TaxID=239 RepID=UPI003529C8A1